MLLIITEIYELSSTFVFSLNLLVVQKYIIPAVKRIYWRLLQGVVSDVPYSTVISLVFKKRFRKDCSLFPYKVEIRYAVRRVSYFSSMH